VGWCHRHHSLFLSGTHTCYRINTYQRYHSGRKSSHFYICGKGDIVRDVLFDGTRKREREREYTLLDKEEIVANHGTDDGAERAAELRA